MSYASSMHDRMIACLLIPCRVVAVDPGAARVRVSDGAGWTSAWLRWHAQAAGKARHWRSPSLGEQGVLLSPSGEPAQGTFIPGLYGNAGNPPDNREHVEVWRFDDGGSLTYDWQANSYSVDLPRGTITLKVGATTLVATPESIELTATNMTLNGQVRVNGALQVSGDILGGGAIIDTAGNTANHKH
ncbi:MAG: phage baseplate assembly protein V [Pseudomonas sp.]|uniref:phage baseplate assembly protein V n=1 Tax=Pseudomonas sp. TaxID=306 RepID=UPI003D14EF81